MDPTFRNLAELLGSQAAAARTLGIDKFRAHRLFHGAPHEVKEIEAIGAAMTIAMPAHKEGAKSVSVADTA